MQVYITTTIITITILILNQVPTQAPNMRARKMRRRNPAARNPRTGIFNLAYKYIEMVADNSLSGIFDERIGQFSFLDVFQVANKMKKDANAP